jgi:glycosyltransferase involved in cell wall biosynthesis
MKILYLSCHEILEFDEVKMFHELGHEVFSPGAYVNPQSKGEFDMRPGIPGLTYNPEILDKYVRNNSLYPGIDGKSKLTKEIVDYFDLIVVMHVPDWIKSNWDVMKHKPVVWRTIGQSVASTEQGLAPYREQGLKIIRYSPNEANIPNFIGSDGLIRFYKDPADYGNWNGDKEEVVTFCQSMQNRGGACNYELFESVTRSFPRKLFGPGNDQPGFGMGKVPYSQLQEEMRNNRVYFYTGTHPASYTLNFMEAWMTGIPIVAIGPKYGNAEVWRTHNLYEIPSLIQNGVNGFISDNPAELHSFVHTMLTDKQLAVKISRAGREEAIRHFGKDMIYAAWQTFLDKI